MSNTTTIGNFSVSSVNFSVPQGDTISSVQNTATLTLVPDSGYQIAASDFSYVSGPSQITGATFTQSGANVLCVVTFDTSYVMPSEDVDLPICIQGSATLINYNLSGIIELIAGTNITPSTGNTAYSATGENGETVQAFTFTVSADSGYYFPTTPQGSITAGIASDYTITSSNTTDVDGKITATTFTANYTFGAQNATNNVFTIVANTKAIPVVVREITSYAIDTSNLPFDSDTTRNMKIYGSAGATFSLTAVNEDGTSILNSPLSNVVMPSNGVYSFNITFPSVTDNDHYDFALTGDLADTFDTVNGQPSTFTINQYLDITLTYGVNTTNTLLNVTSDITYTYPPDSTLNNGDSNYSYQAIFIITSGSEISVSADPLTTDWPNLVAANNGGTETTLESCETALTNSNSRYTITLNGITTETGLQDVLSEIDLDSFLSTNYTPEASVVRKTIEEDETDPADLVVTLLGYDADGDTLTYTIVSLPTNGDIYASTDTTFTTPLGIGAITGNSFLYKPDANYNGVENFLYKVNDGSIDSNTANIEITVTPVNDAPIITSTPQPFTGVQGATYTYNFTYDDIDHTDPQVAITTQSALPSGWTLTDNNDGTGVLSGPVPAGLTTIVLIATDSGNPALSDSQTINVSAAYDILNDMEFLVSYRGASNVSAGTGQSPKTTSAINISGEPSGLTTHTCARADFVLVAETLDSNGNTLRFLIGSANLNNRPWSSYHQQKMQSGNEDQRPTSAAVNLDVQYLDLTVGGRSEDPGSAGRPVATYSASNPKSYYVYGSIGNDDRHEYLTIPTSTIQAMTNPTTGTATGQFTLKLLGDSFDIYDASNVRLQADKTGATHGRLDIHSDGAWLQVFKRNSAGTNQEEVLDSNGNSFSVTTASTVTIDIFTGSVTVT